MNIQLVPSVLLWSTVITYGILLVWFLFFILAHDWMYQFTADGFIFQWSSTGGCRLHHWYYPVELGPYIALHICRRNMRS